MVMFDTRVDDAQAVGGTDHSAMLAGETTPASSAVVATQSAGTTKGRFWTSTPGLVFIWILLLALSILTSTLDVLSPLSNGLFISAFAAFLASGLIAAVRTVLGIVALVRPPRSEPAPEPGVLLVRTLGNLVMAGFGSYVAYLATVGFSRGRQLRRLGKVLLSGLETSSAWASTPFALSRDPARPVPTEVADQWRENGRTEHASVAAFARLTLDLMALGAPPSLIRAANQDALDEIRHTEICFALATAIDGQRVSPAPFPEAQRVSTLPRSRTLALAKLAVDSLIDGALHEGVSARIIAKLAQRCEVPAITAALREIAADEGRHAAHGWAVVEWCRMAGGGAIEHALLGAIRALPREMRSELPKAAADGAWEAWGIHGNQLEADEYQKARANVVARIHHLMQSRRHAA
jgi:hypothetical protein